MITPRRSSPARFAAPSKNPAGTDMSAELSAQGVRVEFSTRSGRVARALDASDLRVRAGEVVARAVASGSGRMTLARTLIGLERPVSGAVLWNGKPLVRSGRGLKALRR